MSNTVVSIEGRTLRLSNLGKLMYPATGYAKAQVIDYYKRVSPVLLPHLAGRPLVMKRYPNGVEGEFFYEKECPSHRPAWVRRVNGAGGKNYCAVDDLATLIWVANLGALELHSLLSRAPDLDRPTVVTFDLDPGAPADILDCLRVALPLRDALADLGLQSFAKTSGGKGVHVYVPLNTPAAFEGTRRFARLVAQALERRYPDLVTSAMSPALRAGKVFVDWSQNSSHKSTVSVYSLRAAARPVVSAPVTWAEIEAALDGWAAEALEFTPDDVLARVESHGDIFAPVASLEQMLPA